MEQYFQDPALYLPILVGLAGVLAWYVYNRKYRKAKKGDDKLDGEQTEAKDTSLLARVYCNLPLPARIKDDEDITPDEQKAIIERSGTLGQIRDHYGKKKLILYQDDKGDLRPVPIPAVFIKSHPRKLYNDIRQPAAAVVYDMSEEKDFLGKWGKLLWWVAVLAFIMFMVISSMRG